MRTCGFGDVEMRMWRVGSEELDADAEMFKCVDMDADAKMRRCGCGDAEMRKSGNAEIRKCVCGDADIDAERRMLRCVVRHAKMRRCGC